jgi:mannitol 2-dehydrogenase
VLACLASSGPPTTVFGLVVEALARRRARGIPPFTVLSCDNVQGNGDVARAAFAGYAELRDPDLAAWVREHVAFPNSMVDRITPATTEEDRAQLRADVGVDDGWPVVCEPYQQWVLEDVFCNGRPAWEQVGVQLVPDVRPYELMKLRLLNAGHQALGHLGQLAGYRYADEACSDPVLRAFLLAYMEQEATPTLEPVPGVDLAAYRQSLVERFSNVHVRDTLARLCTETSDRIPTFLLPVVRAQQAVGGSFSRSALVVAAWARNAEGVDDRGAPLTVIDRLRDTILAAAAAQRADPTAFVRRTGVFGDLADDEPFLAEVATHIESLRRHGARRCAELLT